MGDIHEDLARIFELANGVGAENEEEFIGRIMDESLRDYTEQQEKMKPIIKSSEITKILGRCKKIKKDDKIILDANDCVVCLDLYKEGEYKRNVPCGHIFHKRCIDKWFKIKRALECPLCKKVFNHIQKNKFEK